MPLRSIDLKVYLALQISPEVKATGEDLTTKYLADAAVRSLRHKKRMQLPHCAGRIAEKR